MDAIVKGTSAGLELLLNIVAMLIVLVALVYLANAVLGLLPAVGGSGISLQRMLGYVMAPVCWLMGLPWPQAITAGSLMGTKTVLNELIAYVDLSKLGTEALDARSRLIMLYAMCGFANFGSLGIMIGGLGTMAPERRDEINSLGLKSIVSGTLTTCLIGAIVGVLTLISAVIPGRAPWRGPGIHNHQSGLWIPGSRCARPGMTACNYFFRPSIGVDLAPPHRPTPPP